jgi:hypothetical protein
LVPKEEKIRLLTSYFPVFRNVPSLKLWGASYRDKREEKEFYSSKGGGEEGILIVLAGGAGSTPTGGFGFPVQLAFAFDGEELIGRLPQLKVAGNLFAMLGKGYRGVSTDKPTPLGGDHFFVTELKVEKL